MKQQKDLNHVWVWARVEAMADGSLEPAEARRMHEAMRGDADLDAAVRRAAAVRRGLRSIEQARVPRGLLTRILAAPQPRPGRDRSWAWAAAPAAVAIAAVAAVMLYGGGRPDDDAARLAAVQEFNVAMYYLQKSVAIANRKVEDEVGNGLFDAIDMSRSRLDELDEQTGG